MQEIGTQVCIVALSVCVCVCVCVFFPPQRHYTLYSVLYILFFLHFILCILPLCCTLQYLHCPWSGPDSHFTAGYTISV